MATLREPRVSTAEIAVMGPEGMVSIFAQKKPGEIEDACKRFIAQAAEQIRRGTHPYVRPSGA